MAVHSRFIPLLTRTPTTAPWCIFFFQPEELSDRQSYFRLVLKGGGGVYTAIAARMMPK